MPTLKLVDASLHSKDNFSTKSRDPSAGENSIIIYDTNQIECNIPDMAGCSRLFYVFNPVYTVSPIKWYPTPHGPMLQITTYFSFLT